MRHARSIESRAMRMLLVLVLLTACGTPAAPPGERALAVWSEFLSDDAVRAQLGFCAREGVDLYLAIPSTRIGDPALAALLRAADAAGVGVRAWLLLPEADGYWPNEHNLAAMRAAALAFADWRDAEGLPVKWIVFDMEMSLARNQEVQRLRESEGQVAAVEAIKAGRDPVAYAAARAGYGLLVDELHARQLQVMAVTLPMVLDDAEDGDDDIQDGFDIPIFGIPWDEVSFMVYQSLVYDFLGSWHGPDLIDSYARSAVAQLGARAAVALGIVGSAGIAPVTMPYPDAPTLLADHAAARAAGVGRVSVYSLDGLVQQAEPGSWLDRDIAPQVPEYGDAETLRALVRGLLD
jgi:hypothetical protein